MEITTEKLLQCKRLLEEQEIDTSNGVYVAYFDRSVLMKKIRPRWKGRRFCFNKTFNITHDED